MLFTFVSSVHLEVSSDEERRDNASVGSKST